MEKLQIPRSSTFAELDLASFDQLKFSIYLLDFQWHYLFVNEFVKKNLGERGADLKGRNMWTTFTQLAEDTSFIQLKTDAEKGKTVNFITNSPLTGQRLNVIGYALQDCYFFYSSILPKKEELMSELRTAMNKQK